MKKTFLVCLVFNIVMLPIFFIFLPKIAFVPIVALALQVTLFATCAVIDSSANLLLSRCAACSASLAPYLVAVWKVLFEGQAIS